MYVITFLSRIQRLRPHLVKFSCSKLIVSTLHKSSSYHIFMWKQTLHTLWIFVMRSVVWWGTTRKMCTWQRSTYPQGSRGNKDTALLSETTKLQAQQFLAHIFRVGLGPVSNFWARPLTQSVEISWFFYHSDFTWNQFGEFLKCKISHFTTFIGSESWLLWIFVLFVGWY